MSASLKAALFSAARVNAGLEALLNTAASPPVFRWYDQRLPQNSQGFPCIVVKMISNPADYAFTGRMPTSFSRVQFECYGTGNDSENANALVTALASFLDSFNGDGIAGRVQSPNYIAGDRDAGIQNTQPLTYMRIVDARIFFNSQL